MDEPLESRLERIEAKTTAHAIAIKIVLAELHRDPAQLAQVREKVCGGIERALLAKGFSHAHVLGALQEAELLFPLGQPRPDR